MNSVESNNLLRLIIIFYCFFSSTQLFATSFDCTKATQESEKMVCNSPVLSSLDDKMFLLYSKAKTDSKNPEDLIQAQILWIKQMRTCSEEPCMVNLYNQRISELSPVSTTVVAPTPPIKPEENKQIDVTNNIPDIKGTLDNKLPEVPVLPSSPTDMTKSTREAEIQSALNDKKEINSNNVQNKNKPVDDLGLSFLSYLLGSLATILIFLSPLLIKKLAKK